MKALIYNIRGFGQQGQHSQLKGFMRDHRLDILGLQETIKQDFSTAELRSLECGSPFIWNWVLAEGHSGGMLLGFREESFEVGEWKKGNYFISASIMQCSNLSKWSFVLLYGPADHGRSVEFLDELTLFVSSTLFPVVVGGDFNLIRGIRDKSNGIVN
jgi:exonuclease III